MWRQIPRDIGPVKAKNFLRGADDMNELSQHVLNAHGGLEPRSRFNSVQATIITGGELFAIKNEHKTQFQVG
jgi:hypothetical protein